VGHSSNLLIAEFYETCLAERHSRSSTLLGDYTRSVFCRVPHDFQGSLLAGFLRAASRLIDASDSDIWITSRGVQALSLELPGKPRREMAAGVPGVVETGRVCMAFAVYRTPDGTQQVSLWLGPTQCCKRFPIPIWRIRPKRRHPRRFSTTSAIENKWESAHCQQKSR